MKTIDIINPNGDRVTIQPVPRSKLQPIDGRLSRLSEIWIEERFSTGDVFAREDAWAEMQAIADMLPLQNDPALAWGRDGLDKIARDYEQLEALFLGDVSRAYDARKDLVLRSLPDTNSNAIIAFEVEKFIGPKLLWLHEFEPVKKMVRAYNAQSTPETSQEENSPQMTSQSEAQAA